MNSSPRVTYVARSFLDYRVPVLMELSRLTQGQLTFVTSDKWTPRRVLENAHGVLGDRLIVLTGERSIGEDAPTEANRSICLPYQPGLLKAIRKTTPQLLVGDGFFQWSATTLWLRAIYGIPHVICYERTAHTERHAQWYRRGYRKFAMRYVDAICCSGSLCGQYTQSLGFPKDRITYGHMVGDVDGIRHAVDNLETDEVTRARQRLGNAEVILLYVGRLIPCKGLSQLLAGWSRLHDPERVGLVLIGDGEERALLESQVRDLRLQNVQFLGAIDYDNLAPYYAASDAFIIPTLEDNWSLVVPEAMAAGLPILCSKYNGCWPELVQEGVNGWVFDPLDVDSTVGVLTQSVQNRGILASMGDESTRIVSRHNPTAAAQAILDACTIARNRKVGPT